MTSLVIPSRFCGPPGMGNGGYVCGRLAGYLDGPAEVMLRRPTPLDRPLSVVKAQDGVLLMDGESVLAEARPNTPAADAVRTATHAQAVTAAAAPSIPDAHHPLPHCFVCGPGRASGDGMHIRPGRLGIGGAWVLAAPWTPASDLTTSDGLVAPEFVWAALDCPGGYAVVADDATAVLLGKLTATILRRPEAGEPCAVTAWPSGRDGRKLFAGSAVFGADGALIARGWATWILVPPEALQASACAT